MTGGEHMPDQGYSRGDVREGRALAKQGKDAAFALGDLALRIAPTGKDGAHNGSERVLMEYAKEVGVEYNALSLYRAVSNKWPKRARIAGASWSAHRESMDDPKRLARMAAKYDRVTVDMLRGASGKRQTRYTDPTGPSASRAERIEAARELVADPAVARALIDDESANRAIHQARERKVEEIVGKRRAVRHPLPRTLTGIWLSFASLGDAAKLARHDAQQTDFGALGAKNRKLLRDYLTDARADLDASLAMLDGISDDELAALLEAGQ